MKYLLFVIIFVLFSKEMLSQEQNPCAGNIDSTWKCDSVLFSTQCYPYGPGDPYCTIKAHYCVRNIFQNGTIISREVIVNEYQYSGAGCSCMNKEYQILKVIFERERNFYQILDTGCYYNFQLVTTPCWKEVHYDSCSIIINCQSDVCCRQDLTVCYTYACLQPPCPFRVSSITSRNIYFPSNVVCPFDCQAECDRFTFPTDPDPQYKLIEIQEQNNTLDEAKLNDIIDECFRKNEGNECKFIIGIYDIIGNEIANVNIESGMTLHEILKDLKNGIYFFKLNQGDRIIHTGKITIIQ
jgi:hypothetical protein